MKRGRPVPHFSQVDLQNVRSCFFDDRSHRAYLKIPLLGDRGDKTLCIVGQNPSAADENEADKTIRYLEELVFSRFKEYGQIVVLNLYSQVDTWKSLTSNPLHPKCSELFLEIADKESDFLMVYGKLANGPHYRFLDRAKEVGSLLRSKNTLKIDIGTSYAPHPGNRKIIYSNFDVGFSPYTFSDVDLD